MLVFLKYKVKRKKTLETSLFIIFYSFSQIKVKIEFPLLYIVVIEDSFSRFWTLFLLLHVNAHVYGGKE